MNSGDTMKFKNWLINKYLPSYCREELMERNKKLVREKNELRTENDRLRSYISGMENGLKTIRKIQIFNKGNDK